jgi:putative membrane protein
MFAIASITVGGFATRIGFEPLPLVVVIAALVSYGVGLSRLDRPWPVGRTVAWVGGWVLVAFPMLSGMASWDGSSFTIYATTDLLVGLLAPICLALAAPLTLAVETGGPRVARAALALRDGSLGQVVFHFLFAWILWTASLFGLYLFGFYGAARSHEILLQLAHLELLVAGCVFIFPVLGPDRAAHRPPVAWRVAWFFVGIPYYTVFGMAVDSFSRSPATGISSNDFHAGGDVIWSGGTVIALLGAAGVLVWWLLTDLFAAREEESADDEALELQAAMWRVSRLLAKPEAVQEAEREAAARAGTVATGPVPDRPPRRPGLGTGTADGASS